MSTLPCNDLGSNPLGGPNTVEDEVAGNLSSLATLINTHTLEAYLKQDNTRRQKLLSNVELTLSNTNISHEKVCESVSTRVVSVEYIAEYRYNRTCFLDRVEGQRSQGLRVA